MFLEDMTQQLYSWLQTKDTKPSKWMLHPWTKTDLRNKLVHYCLKLQVNKTSLELQPFLHATYDEIRSLILKQGWDRIYRRCGHYLVSCWQDGQPNGQQREDCIVNGPDSDYKYKDVPCDISDDMNIGFACRYHQPYV